MSDAPAGKAPSAVTSFLRTGRMIAWSLLGIRKSSGLQSDAAQANPFHIIVGGIVAVLLLVVGLIVVVNLVVAK